MNMTDLVIYSLLVNDRLTVVIVTANLLRK